MTQMETTTNDVDTNRSKDIESPPKRRDVSFSAPQENFPSSDLDRTDCIKIQEWKWVKNRFIYKEFRVIELIIMRIWRTCIYYMDFIIFVN